MIDKTHSANIHSILSQIRQFEARVKEPLAPPITRPIGLEAPGNQASSGTEAPGFGSMVKNALDSVNALQEGARQLSLAHERGENVPLTDVVLAMHRTSVAFEATLQIRNKVMKAYEDIRNMPI
jgi:flagellar hook-basal body complex protein FliE